MVLLTSLGSINGKSGSAVCIALARCGICSITLNSAGFSVIIGVAQLVGATAFTRMRSGASMIRVRAHQAGDGQLGHQIGVGASATVRHVQQGGHRTGGDQVAARAPFPQVGNGDLEGVPHADLHDVDADPQRFGGVALVGVGQDDTGVGDHRVDMAEALHARVERLPAGRPCRGRPPSGKAFPGRSFRRAEPSPRGPRTVPSL